MYHFKTSKFSLTKFLLVTLAVFNYSVYSHTVLWDATKYSVADEIRTTHLYSKLVSPCIILPTVTDFEIRNRKECDNYYKNHIIKHLSACVKEEYLLPFNQTLIFDDDTAQKSKKRRPKRVFVFVVPFAAAVIFVVVAAIVVGVAIAGVWIANGARNNANHVREELRSEISTAIVIHNQLKEKIALLDEKLVNQTIAQQMLTHNSNLANRIITNILLTEISLIEFLDKGKVSPDRLHSLFPGLDLDENYPKRHWQLLNCRRDGMIYLFELDTPKINPNLVVSKASPFRTVLFQNNKVCFQKYKGNTYRIENVINGCVSELYESDISAKHDWVLRYESKKCFLNNSQIDLASNWVIDTCEPKSKLLNANNIEAFGQKMFQAKFDRFNNVHLYCIGLSIEVDNERPVRRCPNEVLTYSRSQLIKINGKPITSYQKLNADMRILDPDLDLNFTLSDSFSYQRMNNSALERQINTEGNEVVEIDKYRHEHSSSSSNWMYDWVYDLWESVCNFVKSNLLTVVLTTVAAFLLLCAYLNIGYWCKSRFNSKPKSKSRSNDETAV